MQGLMNTVKEKLQLVFWSAATAATLGTALGILGQLVIVTTPIWIVPLGIYLHRQEKDDRTEQGYNSI